jgi:tyrosyl-tRNA synthetase
LGGATGTIGDPTFRTASRPSVSPSVLANNLSSIRKQLDALLGKIVPLARKQLDLEKSKDVETEILDNQDWLGRLPLIEWLRGPAGTAKMKGLLARGTSMFFTKRLYFRFELTSES